MLLHLGFRTTISLTELIIRNKTRHISKETKYATNASSNVSGSISRDRQIVL